MPINEINKDQKEYIDSFLTKQGKIILINIHDNPGICSSDLANILGIKKNSMSNALDRLRKSKYELIWSEPQGRKKHYFLTEWGEIYTVSCLKLDKSNTLLDDKCNISDDESLLRNKARESIADLNKINPEWQFIFFEFLNNGNACKNEEMRELMINLLLVIQHLYELDYQTSFEDIMGLISYSSVKERILQCIERQQAIKPLWDWSEESWTSAYHFIDEVFDSNSSLLQSGLSFDIEDYEYLDKEQIHHILGELLKLVDEAQERNLTKMQFYQYMIERYPLCDERLAFYISEKYKEILGRNGKS